MQRWALRDPSLLMAQSEIGECSYVNISMFINENERRCPRAVWPGDMGIAVPTQFVSTNDLIPTRNALSTMFAGQNPETGALPESGPPLSQQGSDTYHAWTLIGTHNYFLYSGDLAWMQNTWINYTKAVQYLENKVDGTGLLNVTGLRDWGRLWQGGHNSEANAIFYKVYVLAPPSI